MISKINFFIFLFLVGFACSSPKEEEELRLKNGLVITESVKIQKDSYFFKSKRSLETSTITIQGNNLVIDFSEAVLNGANKTTLPNNFKGVGIKVIGEHIIIKNLKIRGFKIGLLAENVKHLTIENCDFSYNYKDRLEVKKTSEKPLNKLENGAGVYLKKCNKIVFKNNKITNGQNGIVLEECDEGQFYNNTIQFNSGIGIRLSQSNKNVVTHNKLDWNIGRGNKNSGGILIENECDSNTIAKNSITHCEHNIILRNIGKDKYNFVGVNDLLYNKKDSLIEVKAFYELPENLDLMDYRLSKYQPQGEQYILVNEWGVYDFQRPVIWLREKKGNEYTFILLAPEGNWKLLNTEGLDYISLKRGNFPATVVARKSADAQKIKIDLQFLGQAITTQFGETLKKGTPFSFGFEE